MEAIAKHNFKKTADDELGFNKGDVLKVLNQTDDANWFKAEREGHQGYIPKNYITMDTPRWLVNQGVVSRAESEKYLLKKNKRGDFAQPDGAFLVRNSESTPGDFSLSVKFDNNVQHFKILTDEQGKYFLWIVKFSSINKLIEHHRGQSVSRSQEIKLKDLIVEGDQKDDTSNKVYVRALYDFTPQEENEVEFRKGDIIEVTDQSDSNWWTGRLHGREGTFPATYVAAHTH